MMTKLIGLDHDLFLIINGFHNSFFDSFMLLVSGKLTWVPLYLFIYYRLFRKYNNHFWLPVLLLIVVVGLSDWTSVHWFKEEFQRYRPCHTEGIKEVVHLVNNHCGGKFGFISSHASNSFAVAVFTSLLLKKYSCIFFLVWATLVAYSRIYLGVHFPADVLVGAMWGGILAYSGFAILYLIKQTWNYPKNTAL